MAPKYRRASWHDYSGRSIYMVTIATRGRQPVLGHLTTDESGNAAIAPTDLGRHVTECWNAISTYHPEVKPVKLQLMPDHIHGLLFVTTAIGCQLGGVIRGFKIAAAKPFKLATGNDLWERNFHDRALSGNGQLERMDNYISDNPRRLAVRRADPQLFRVRRQIRVAGTDVAMQGNIFLLAHPLLEQVQLSRTLKQEDIAQRMAQSVDKAGQGTILVSPRISEAEKQVVDAALDAGGRLIMIVPEGMDTYTKPSGKYFDLMAQGRLLTIAPWPDAPQDVPLTRAMCLAMNNIAAAIVAEATASHQATPQASPGASPGAQGSGPL